MRCQTDHATRITDPVPPRANNARPVPENPAPAPVDLVPVTEANLKTAWAARAARRAKRNELVADPSAPFVFAPRHMWRRRAAKPKPPASPPCCLGFGTMRDCPNQCAGRCGYEPA